MRTLWQDVKFSARMLVKNPGFALVAVLALALGIAANTTIFGAINALLLQPYQFREMDRMVQVFETLPKIGVRYGSVAPANFLDIRRESKSFESLAFTSGWSVNLTEGDRPERVTGASVSSHFFETLGVRVKLGREFTPEEEQPGHSPVVILSDDLWRRKFNADAGAVGRAVRINERNFTIVGVAPPELKYPRGNVEMWSPYYFDERDTTDRESHYLRVVGRLKNGVTIEQASQELNLIAGRLSEQHPLTNEGRSFRAYDFLDIETRGPKPYLLIMLAAVGFVMLIACANVANLLLLRASERTHEIAVRTALGASRWRVIRQLLTESVLLSALGGALGLLASVWLIDLLAAGLPANFARFVPGWSGLGIDWRVFGFTFLLSLATGVLFGLFPAVQSSKANLNETLKEGGRTGAGQGRGRNRARAALVVFEVALSLVLLVGAGLMVRSFIELAHVDPGFDTGNAVSFGVALPQTKYREKSDRVEFQKRLLERLETLPGVASAASVNTLPLDFEGSDTGFWLDGTPQPAPGETTLAKVQIISPDYFKTMRIPLVAGRQFDARDRADAAPVVIISRRLAAKFFKDRDAVGSRVRAGDGKEAFEIVGIAGDVEHEPLSDNDERAAQVAIYYPHAQVGFGQMYFVVRAGGNEKSVGARAGNNAGESGGVDALSLINSIRDGVAAIDKDQPIYNVRTLDQIFGESMAPQRLSAFMFAGFALVALVLAAVGIYAVVAYSVAQRTHEIGIRMALGAGRRDIFRLVVGQGMKLIAVGVVLGLIAAFGVTRLMASVLYNVSAGDTTTFIAIPALLVAVAALACYVPARRATKVDPMVALRYE